MMSSSMPDLTRRKTSANRGGKKTFSLVFEPDLGSPGDCRTTVAPELVRGGCRVTGAAELVFTSGGEELEVAPEESSSANPTAPQRQRANAPIKIDSKVLRQSRISQSPSWTKHY